MNELKEYTTCDQRFICSDISAYCCRTDYKICPYFVPYSIEASNLLERIEEEEE